jgi:hypothetical protein
MRLPGTRYQEHGWEQVRKLLGQCSLYAFAHLFAHSSTDSAHALLFDPDTEADVLGEYVDLTAAALRAGGCSARAEASGNSYGDSVHELALALLYELHARPAEWTAFAAAVANEHRKIGPFWEHAGGEAILRKKVNDMYAVLRDKVDADNYQAACGRPCSANKIYAFRMLDTAFGDIARIFEAWQEHVGQVGVILGRPVIGSAPPIEVRQMKSIAACKPEWLIRWSESRERFTGVAGPLHTRSKRFASLRNNPGKIGAMLREIGEYEELSANRDCDWRQDSTEAANWLDDLARVWGESEQAASIEGDRILEPRDDGFGDATPEERDTVIECGGDEPIGGLAASVSLSPRYMEMARTAQDRTSWSADAIAAVLSAGSLPVRLAVYLKILGAQDDSYPEQWLDPATGELPTMQQLAVLDQVSLPTLRKRRDAAIAALLAAARP